MAGGSEEYLAALGFDTSDVDKAVNQTITLLGHLGSQFDSVSKQTQAAERSLLKVGGAAKTSGGDAKVATKDWLALSEAIYDQSKAYKDIESARKAALGNITGEDREATAQARVADATFKRTEAERKLNAEKNRGFQTSRQQMSAWDKEFNALTKATDAQKDMAFTAPSLRYALYDISATANIAAGAITALGAATLITAGSFESAFTNVERTLDDVGADQVEEIRQSLLRLSREIPKSFQELSAVATLGNALGIAAEDLESFTGTIARFSTVSGVSAEETSKIFGAMTSILGISADEFENLGSAITLVGRKSAATDAEILSLTKEVGQQATAAGFAASEVVALAGALGQLRVPPERSRGALTTYFGTLNKAVADGGEDLEKFASILGLTSEQLDAMVRSGRGAEVFQRFLGALSNLDSVDTTKALDELGLAQLRVSDTFQRLSSDLEMFNTYAGISAQGYAEGTELARQYALVVDDLASKWQLFLNALMEFGNSVGSTILPAAGTLLDVTTKLLLEFAKFAESPLGRGMTILATGVAGLAAALLAVAGMGAGALASLVAIRFAMQQLGIQAATTAGGIRGLALATIGLQAGAGAAATAMRVLRLALISTGVGALVVAMGFLIGLMVDFEGTITSVKEPLNFVIDAFGGLATGAAYAGRAIAQYLLPVLQIIPAVGDQLRALANITNSDIQGMVSWATGMARKGLNSITTSSGDATTRAAELGAQLGRTAASLVKTGTAAGGLGGKFDDMGKSAGGAAREVRTLVDYANDIQGVLSRAFDIRFGGSQGSDQILAGWSAIRKAIAETNQQIRDYRAEMLSLSSDKAIREYWLSVAENYGDTLRAGVLRAEIAEIDAKLAKTSKDLSAAQQKNSKTLEGNSDAAIENRAEILGLVQNYQSYIQALAASGVPADELLRKTDQLKREFVQQAKQLGYNETELQKYAAGFDDITLAIQRVPRNITVNANTNPAMQALNEFLARANSSRATVSIGSGSVAGQGAAAGNQYGTAFKNALDSVLSKANVKVIPGGTLRFDSSGKMIEGNVGNLRFFRSGTAWTGDGAPWDPVGIVHAREAVLNERGNRMVPDSFINAANQGRNPWQYAPGQGASVKFPSVMMVELSPIDREILASGQSVTVTVSSDDLARATGGANDDDNRRGGA